MAYLSLYRRYRPDNFSGIIGQGHIVRTLINQVKNGNVSHAYLFTGTRGTGKTSVARIFARAVNCLSPVDGSPCGKCSVCTQLANSNNLDIIEIDAASNSTVDDIRDLIEKVKYPPVVGKYKVYIVDEVHMLSTSAFNALLKTLEEPPRHAIFILATTDVHKLPQTVLSRCMRFDFKLLATPALADNLKRIFDDIGKKYEEEAVNLIASAAEGSARDSLSIADMCVAYCENEITYDAVLDVLGASDPNIIVGLVENLVDRDTSSALLAVEGLASFGKNISVLAKDIAFYARCALFIKSGGGAEQAVKLPKDIYQRLSVLAGRADSGRLLKILELFNGINGELRYSTQPRIILEAAIFRAAFEPADSEILLRLKAVENKLSQTNPLRVAQNIAVSQSTAAVLRAAGVTEGGVYKQSARDAKPADKDETALSNSKEDNLIWDQMWDDIQSNFASSNNLQLAVLMMQYINCSLKGDTFKAVMPETAVKFLSEKNKADIEKKLSDRIGRAIKLIIVQFDENTREKSVDDKLKELFGEKRLKIVK